MGLGHGESSVGRVRLHGATSSYGVRARQPGRGKCQGRGGVLFAVQACRRGAWGGAHATQETISVDSRARGDRLPSRKRDRLPSRSEVARRPDGDATGDELPGGEPSDGSSSGTSRRATEESGATRRDRARRDHTSYLGEAACTCSVSDTTRLYGSIHRVEQVNTLSLTTHITHICRLTVSLTIDVDLTADYHRIAFI